MYQNMSCCDKIIVLKAIFKIIVWIMNIRFDNAFTAKPGFYTLPLAENKIK